MFFGGSHQPGDVETEARQRYEEHKRERRLWARRRHAHPMASARGEVIGDYLSRFVEWTITPGKETMARDVAVRVAVWVGIALAPLLGLSVIGALFGA